MDIFDCINNKRSVRNYTDEKISRETIEELIKLGTKASTGSGEEPWGFVILEDGDEIEKLSKEIKTYILNNYEKYPYLSQYESWLKNEKYSVFNHASTLIIIYGNTDSHWYLYDCSLAASNIMLAAHAMNIGTCWIGFAEYWLNTKEFKQKYNVPENYNLVAPISCGYMKGKLVAPRRKDPKIFNN